MSGIERRRPRSVQARWLLSAGAGAGLLSLLMSCSPAAQSQAGTAVAQLATLQAAVATAQAAGTQIAGVPATAAALATAISTAPGDVLGDWFGREVPADVGVLADDVKTSASADKVRQAFVEAFQKAGGTSALGQPDGRVIELAGSLIQTFQGGSQAYGAVVMSAYGSQAYSVAGEWYKTYIGAGGPERAGYPAGDAEAWGPGWWGRGKRQLFVVDGEYYALLKAGNSDNVHVVPPQFWAVYDSGHYVDKLGFPLAGFPLDEQAWEAVAGLSADTRQLLAQWQRSPYRVMVFEKGSIWLDASGAKSEVVERASLSSFNLLTGAGRAFNEAYTDPTMFATNNCTLETFRHGVIAGGNQAVKEALQAVAFLPLDATTAVVFSGPGMARFALRAGYAFFKMLGTQEWAEATAWFAAGEVLDAAFTGLLGEFLAEDLHLSAPLTETSLEVARLDFEKMAPSRLSETVLVRPNMSSMFGPSTMTAKLVLLYDPLTRMATLHLTSECLPKGVLVQYRVDPATGYPLDPVGVWDGRLVFWDLATEERLP